MAQERPQEAFKYCIVPWLYLLIRLLNIISNYISVLDPKMNRIQYANMPITGIWIGGAGWYSSFETTIALPPSIHSRAKSELLLPPLDLGSQSPGRWGPWRRPRILSFVHQAPSLLLLPRPFLRLKTSSLKILKIHAVLFPDIFKLPLCWTFIPPFYGKSMKILTHPHQRPPTALRLLGAT